MPNFNLSIKFVSGTDLLAADTNGKSDPYLKCILGNKTYTTKIINKTLNPVWGEEWHVNAVPEGTNLWIEAFDYDRATKDDTLGVTHLKLTRDIPLGNWTGFDLPLRLEGGGKEHGKLHIEVRLVEGQSAHEGPPHQFSMNISKTAGLFAHAGSGERTNLNPKFSTWQIELHLIEKHFGDVRQHWNVHYEAAQKIFGDNTKGNLVRGAVRSQHKLVYGPGTRQVDGNIFNGDDLLNLINHGQRDGKTPFYTYAIANHKKDHTRWFFRFAETGSNKGKDFFSKHAMHANARPEVVYSGEFHIQQKGDKYIFVIDNNSGTYAPDKTLLPKLRALMEDEFPGLLVEALDREDPQLAAYKAALAKKK